METGREREGETNVENSEKVSHSIDRRVGRTNYLMSDYDIGKLGRATSYLDCTIRHGGGHGVTAASHESPVRSDSGYSTNACGVN